MTVCSLRFRPKIPGCCQEYILIYGKDSTAVSHFSDWWLNSTMFFFIVLGLPLHMSIWSSSTVCLDIGKTVSNQKNYQNNCRHHNTHNRNIHRYVSGYPYLFDNILICNSVIKIINNSFHFKEKQLFTYSILILILNLCWPFHFCLTANHY